MNSIYVVTMYRYGDREKHSYVLGAFSTPELAHRYGQVEFAWRGSKYHPEIVECKIDTVEILNLPRVVEVNDE
jgi:hypothetical protein